MLREDKLRIEIWLKRFPVVRWDRFIDFGNFYAFYGWIDRKDNNKDFLIIEYDKKEKTITHWMSSRAQYDDAFIEIFKHSRFMQDALNNAKCQRIENNFNIPNSIKLKKDKK